MGGDTLKDEEESSGSTPPSSYCVSNDFGFKDGESFPNLSKRREKSYQEILLSHQVLQKNSKLKLKLARNQILSYTPGSWADFSLSDYDIPKTTSILVVGPKGAGKSSLINRIARVIQDDEFAPARAQESYGTSCKGGTFFVQEYMIPRGSSASFCLYDTRGFSTISSDNTSKIEQWITRGVQHGEPVIWTSDSSDLRDTLVRDSGTCCETRKVNSVIFVVNAVEILMSMESGTNYAHMISTVFNLPLLSFKDDKPAVVMTHGEVLSWEERARVRLFLGELLNIPPDKQIFDIPESMDTATGLTVCNLLRHSLVHADKNLRFLRKRNFTISKVMGGVTKKISLLNIVMFISMPLFVVLAIFYLVNISSHGQTIAHEAQHTQLFNSTLQSQPMPKLINKGHVQNHECMSEVNPSSNWQRKRPSRRRRPLRFEDQKVHVPEAEPEPSSDLRRRRRLWYVE